MTIVKRQYNYCLDFIKGLACIFVVFMHCEFPGMMGVAVQAISRFCVPFFFMVSGYFCYYFPIYQSENQLDKSFVCIEKKLRIKKKVIHIIKITFYASLFYLGFVLLRQMLFHNINFAFTKWQLFYWVVLNQPFIITGAYWFLFALMYTYVFYGVLEHFNLRRFEYIFAALLFVVYFILAQGMHLAGVKMLNCYYRNWLIEAFPFFMLGHWIHENQERINISNKSLLTIIILTTLLCWVERWLMGRDFGVNIVTIPQVFALFVYGVKNPTRHEGVIQRLGRDCSMLVYIFHIAVWHSIEIVYQRMGVSENLVALYIMPLLVLGGSIIAALVVNAIVVGFKKNQLVLNTVNR